ncbi:MAG: right-handed parallel beta-helix repeat-containing protein, partial [Candidatus Woesearchaeota archaeon]
NTLGGVYLYDSDNASVLENNISFNGPGLCTYLSGSLTARSNTLAGNSGSGLCIDSSGGLTIEQNTISGTTGAGVNISGQSAITLFNNTISGSSGDGIWLKDNSLINMTNNTITGNSGTGLSFLNSTPVPGYPEVLSVNPVGSDNTGGLISINWYLQVFALNRTGGIASGASVDVYRLNVTGAASRVASSTTGAAGLTPYIPIEDFLINSTGDRINRSYNVTVQQGDFYGFNTTDASQNLVDAEGDAFSIMMNLGLPPTVALISPLTGTSTAVHTQTFRCNASHEGGLANISLYIGLAGSWSLVATNNVTGIANETSFQRTLGDGLFNWNCKASSAFNSSGFASSNFTLQTTATQTGGGTGGGAGGGDTGPVGDPAAPPPTVPPPPVPPPPPVVPPAPEPAPEPEPSPVTESSPEAEAPLRSPEAPTNIAAAKAEGRVKETVNTSSSISCDEEISITEQKLSLEDILAMIDIPEGYEIIANPFKAGCSGGESFTTSVVVPDKFENVTVLKCSGSGCTSRTTTITNRLCPGNDVEVTLKEDMYDISTVATNITTVTIDNDTINGSLKSGDYEIDFGEGIEASISMPKENQPEPINKNLKIAGTPIVVKYEEKGDGSMVVNVTLPYKVSATENELSVSVYAKVVEDGVTKWLYVNGVVDTALNLVKSEVNLSRYAVDGEVTLAPMTIYCEDCGDTEFINHFTPSPDYGNAIIMLHGLWGSGKVWEGMIDEFKMTNQPYQLWSFTYFAQKPLEESAKDLADYLEANNHRFERIYVIGYSLGGLIGQAAMTYAYEENQKDPSKYIFMTKLEKILLVGTPNLGSPIAGYMDRFLSEYINTDEGDFIPVSSAVKDLLLKGRSFEMVPNVSYYVIAGTQTYPFMERLGLVNLFFQGQANDGLVPVKSAQSVGDSVLDEDCVNFWSQPTIHTLLIDDRNSQRLMGQLISEKVFKELNAEQTQSSLFGYSEYFELAIDDCSPDDIYIVIGKSRTPDKIQRPAYCACGNGICGGLEDYATCPEDCRPLEQPLMKRIIEMSLSVLAGLIALFLVVGAVYAIIIHSRKTKEEEDKPPLPPASEVMVERGFLDFPVQPSARAEAMIVSPPEKEVTHPQVRPKEVRVKKVQRNALRVKKKDVKKVLRKNVSRKTVGVKKRPVKKVQVKKLLKKKESKNKLLKKKVQKKTFSRKPAQRPESKKPDVKVPDHDDIMKLISDIESLRRGK